MLGSSVDLVPPDGALEIPFGRDTAGRVPSIHIESLTRHYQPVEMGRLRQKFMVFGGIRPEGAVIDDDEDDDSDDGFDDDDLDLDDQVAGTVALQDVSLRLSGPGCVAFVGSSQAGKSVLFRTIAGLAPPSAGHVEVHGLVAPIIDSTLHFLPTNGTFRRVLPIFGEALRIPARIIRSRMPDICNFLGEPELARRHIATLSRARRRSVLYAMMCAIEPDIVLVDCVLPTGQFGSECQLALRELKRRGALVLIASRDAESVSWIADHVVYMGRGRIVGDEPLDAAVARAHASRDAAAEDESRPQKNAEWTG